MSFAAWETVNATTFIYTVAGAYIEGKSACSVTPYLGLEKTVLLEKKLG